MEVFDPATRVENAASILDGGSWPNFHDATVYSFNVWRGDMLPGETVWVIPTIDAAVELDALEFPYVVDLRFHGCDKIDMHGFDHNNDIYMLSFAYEARGHYADGVTPLPPYIR